MHVRSGVGPHVKLRLAALLIVAFSEFAVAAVAQESSTLLRGTWMATVRGGQVFRGTWSARPVPDSPDASSGSWAVVNGSNQIVMSGTWAATKTARSWSGSWQARIVEPKGVSGRAMSGSWRTQIKASDARTLGELLQHTLRQQVRGAWQSGAIRGTWSVTGS
jgi:hypothetical protein